MHIQRNVSQKRLCLVVLLTGFLLLASGCGGPQSSPGAVVKAFFAAIQSDCKSIANIFLPGDAPYDWGISSREYRLQVLIGACNPLSPYEISGLAIKELRVHSDAAAKLNGFGDQAGVYASFAVRQKGCPDCKGCTDCIWKQDNREILVVQYKGKWWLR